MTTSSESTSSNAEEPEELVFIYGHQWRAGLLVGKINHDGIVGGGVVEGQLVVLGGHPVMAAVKGGGTVRGETYRVPRGQLQEFDRLMESIVPPEGSGRCRRVRVMVYEVKLNQPPMEAWTWRWENLQGQHPVISSGDWLNPGLAPVFTFIALCCLVSFPMLAAAVPLLHTLSRAKGTTPVPPLVSWALLGLTVAAPMAGIYAAYLAHRRKERWSGCLFLIVLGLVILLIILGMGLAKAF